MTDSTLMLMAQITVAERQELKRIAKSKGMTLSGYIGNVCRREIKENTVAEPDLTPQGRDSHGARDSLSL